MHLPLFGVFVFCLGFAYFGQTMRRVSFAMRIFLATVLRPMAPSQAVGAESAAIEWRWTEGAPGGGRYSPLADIDRTNVASLRVAWTYRHGDFYDGGWLPDAPNKGTAFECTPIVADERLIFTTPYNRVIALNPESGRELWTYDPGIDTHRRFANM